jgi:hypothetical protein
VIADTVASGNWLSTNSVGVVGVDAHFVRAGGERRRPERRLQERTRLHDRGVELGVQIARAAHLAEAGVEGHGASEVEERPDLR